MTGLLSDLPLQSADACPGADCAAAQGRGTELRGAGGRNRHRRTRSVCRRSRPSGSRGDLPQQAVRDRCRLLRIRVSPAACSCRSTRCSRRRRSVTSCAIPAPPCWSRAPTGSPSLRAEVTASPALRTVIVVDGTPSVPGRADPAQLSWTELLAAGSRPVHRVVDIDVAAILYTSGSTGRPKGVVLSHRNMVSGATSVVEYLGNTPEDRLLAVLPFSFDYGFSQLTTAFLVGASVSLIDHLFARDVVTAVEKDRITGLAAVPPLWIQLADLQVASGDRRASPVHHELGRTDAARDARQAARRVAADPTLSHVRPHRGIPRHLPSPGGARPAAGFDGQGDSERGDHGRAAGWNALCRGRAGRAGAAWRAGRAGLLERSGQDGRAIQAGARPAAGAAAHGNGRLVRRHGASRRGRFSVLRRAP